MNNSLRLLYCLFLAVVIIQQATSINSKSCEKLNMDGTCSKCTANYHLSDDGKCYAQILGCKKYASENLCVQCEDKSILVNNKCCDQKCLAEIMNSETTEGDFIDDV